MGGPQGGVTPRLIPRCPAVTLQPGILALRRLCTRSCSFSADFLSGLLAGLLSFFSLSLWSSVSEISLVTFHSLRLSPISRPPQA